MNRKLVLVLALILSGCTSSPRMHLGGAVYDGQAHGTDVYGLSGLGFPKLTMEQLGNPTNPPKAFHYNWEPPSPKPKASATLTRIATVWDFDAHTQGGNFTNYVSADYFVFDDDATFHREVSRRLLKEARTYFNSWTDGWSDLPDMLPNRDNWDWNDTQLFCCTPNLVSVGLYPGSFSTHGGPQPFTPLNFVNDRGHARLFTESELFIPQSGWEKKLSDLCLGKLRDAEDVANGTITGFDAEQLSQFTVTPKTLQIHLCPNPEGGGGESVVDIPWSDLRKHLRPDGPARYLIISQKPADPTKPFATGRQNP